KSTPEKAEEAERRLTDDTKRSSVPLQDVGIGDLQAAKDVDWGDDGDGLNARGVGLEGGHFDADGARPVVTGKTRHPMQGQVEVRRLFQVGEAAEVQLVGEDEGFLPGGGGNE